MRIPDLDQRRQALDPGRSFIVQAPAGSGKTELLVRRYLSLLAHVEEPEEILAITFTRKATMEMRQRIANALGQVRADGAAETDPEMLEISRAARANDKRRQWSLLHNTRRLRIQTIDALCSELVRRMPWSARFGGFPEILDDAGELYTRAAARTLAHIEDGASARNAASDLLRLVNADLARATTLLAEMLKRRDKWLRLLKADEDVVRRERIEEMWRTVIETELKATADLVPAQHRREITELADYAAARLAGTDTAQFVQTLQDIEALPPPVFDRIRQWRGLADLLLTATGGLRKQVDKRTGFPPDNREMKERMSTLLAELEGCGQFIAALGAVQPLPTEPFNDEQWRSLQSLVQLLPLSAAELNLLFTERNCSDYIELTQRAVTALGPDDAPTDLALALDYRIRHILVDEFQDTSSAHLALLKGLTAGWQEDDGRSLFLVGDPMQSIYRFREAEVANFIDVQDRGLAQLRLQNIVLETNFRSAPPLVDWFNRTFSVVMPKRNDVVAGAVSYTPASPGRDPGGNAAVHVHASMDSDQARQAGQIAALVRRCLDDEPGQSIALLARARSHLAPIAEALRLEGIPFHAVDMERLAERAEIRDLVELTLALQHPGDRIAWLSLLRAPWCGMSLADITVLAGADTSITLFDLLQLPEKQEALSDTGKNQLARLQPVLLRAWERSGRIPLRQNVEAAWLALGGPATVAAEDLDNCRRYLDLLEQTTQGDAGINRATLADTLAELWAESGVEARVQLLTIHKAKGLEYDTVILPELHRGSRQNDPDLLRWYSLPRELLFAPLPSSMDSKDPYYRYLGELEKTQQRNENGRLLYVACTRACKQLHLFACVKSNDKDRGPREGSLLSLLWPAVATEFEDIEAAADAATAQTYARVTPSLRRLPADWRIPLLVDPELVTPATESTSGEIEFSWVGEAARITGVVIHEMLQQVGQQDWGAWKARGIEPAHVEHWRKRLREHGIPQNALEEALSDVERAVNNLKTDSVAGWIFSPGHREVRAEWALTGIDDSRIVHVVLDRSFIDENGARWIIDFKSSRHEGGDLEGFLDREQLRHEPQMKRYARIVSRLGEDPVRSGLYFPLLRGWRELPG